MSSLLPARRMSGAVRSRSRTAVIPAAAAVLALTLAACGGDQADPLGPAEPSLSSLTAEPSFDWSMPARFGADADGDGLVDYPTPEQIAQESWRVDFDACAIPGDRYMWFVDRRRVARVDTCEYSHAFAAEGSYRVAVVVTGGPEPDVRVERIVPVQDWLILSFGDSYGSGEGVPEVQMASDAVTAEILGLFRNLERARLDLEAARESLREAVERRHQYEVRMITEENRKEAFLDACTIDQFKDVQRCADFLSGLPYSTYEDAKAAFEEKVAEARVRLEDARHAVALARNAVDQLVAATENLKALVQTRQSDFTPPRWQPKLAIEDYDTENPDNVGGPTDCHRSARAASARAALALEAADPRTSVTFLHLACSGSTMTGGRAPLNLQIEWAASLVGDREIDAVLISIGGNDVGFVGLATACATQEPCFSADPQVNLADAALACAPLTFVGGGTACLEFFESAASGDPASELLTAGLAGLPVGYNTLATDHVPDLTGLLEPPVTRPGRGRFARSTPSTGRLRTERVYLIEYSDMTKKGAEDFCGGPPDPSDPFGTMPGFSTSEMKWLDGEALDNINAIGAAAAERHGWGYVDGVAAAFRDHGYCAPNHWMVRFQEAFLRQGDMDGTGHPNRRGHEVTGEFILAELAADLYPEELDGPRPPDPATDTWTPPGLRGSGPRGGPGSGPGGR